MTFETIRIATDTRGVARLTLAQPQKHNALSARMIGELTDAANALSDDRSVRVVILEAEGRSFCAGGDLGWMREQFDADRPARITEATRLAMMFKALNEIAKPVIGRLHGNAFGGGVGLMSICDAAVAAADAKFGLTETRLGLIPATISPMSSPGSARARRDRCSCPPACSVRRRRAPWGWLRSLPRPTHWMRRSKRRSGPIW